MVLHNNHILDNNLITNKLINLAEKTSPKSAVILAAVLGMRMVPINVKTTKGIFRAKGEALIERLIKQLHEAGISDIVVIVGFMKEKYEYLIDKFHVELIVNSKYSEKNNLYSVKLAEKKLANCYIIPCDLYFKENPFSKVEFSSWYMVSDCKTDESSYRINRKYELVKSKKGNRMIGLCYLISQDSKMIRKRIDALCSDSAYDQSFWEKALESNNKLCILAKEISDINVIEINTYEQFRTADSKSDHLNNQAIDIICKTLKIVPEDIHDINTLKKGMTHRSFIFTAKDSRYIMRIPGEGTGHLINRNNECRNYLSLKGMTVVDKYPNADIDLIFNEYYQEYNNISSLYVARNFLDETMIIDGDQIIKNQQVLTPFFERSGYNSVYITQGTNEWLQQEENGKVVSCSRTGGQCGFQLYGISRWTKRDSFQLRQDLELEFVQKHNHQDYWDDVAMFCHPDHYQLGIFEMSSSDVIEIDSIKDLEAFN